MSNSSEIIANERSFQLEWAGDAGPLWILFPGLRFRLHFPALARVQALGLSMGAQICGVATDYDQDPRLADLSQDEAVALIRADARAIMRHLPAPDLLVGKSVGCLALWEIDIPKTRYVWQTPNLTAPALKQVIQERAARSFIVAGAEDPVTPPAELAALDVAQISLPGLDHGLGTGDAAQDAPLLDQMDAALRAWL